MFENPIEVPKKRIKDKGPFKPQPTYDSAKRMFMGGDYYGTGIKAKVGKLRSDTPGISPIPKKSLRIPPESVV